MADTYRIRGETMTGLANVIRALSGETGAKSPNAMGATLQNAYNFMMQSYQALADKGVDPTGVSPSMANLPGLIAGLSGGGGGSVEPFTKIISGTITFAEYTTAFSLPETENFLAAYFIRTDFWGVKDDIFDPGAQVILFASGQSFGWFSPQHMRSALYQGRDMLHEITSDPGLSDGKITFTKSSIVFYGTYYYALIYGTK